MNHFFILIFISILFSLNAAGLYGIITNPHYSELKKMTKITIHILGLFALALFAIYQVISLALRYAV